MIAVRSSSVTTVGMYLPKVSELMPQILPVPTVAQGGAKPRFRCRTARQPGTARSCYGPVGCGGGGRRAVEGGLNLVRYRCFYGFWAWYGGRLRAARILAWTSSTSGR